MTSCALGAIIRIQLRKTAAPADSFRPTEEHLFYLRDQPHRKEAFAITESQKQAFLTRFSRDYDLLAAASKAGIKRSEAYRLLKTAAPAVDRLVRARADGDTLAAIRREYEAIAFGEGEDVRPADRIRALEQLRLMASAGREDGGAPTLTVRYEYV